MQTILFRVYHVAKFRVLPMLLAMIMLLSVAPLTVFSVDLSEEPKTDLGYDSPSELPYDYDTLKITLDGEETYALSLYEHEKIEICATGVSEQATYQWQIQHNEKDDLWVDIYDATDPTLSLTAALIGGVLRDDGTAKVRCRAYTQDYAYLTTPFTVTLLEEEPVTYLSTPMQSADMPSFMADGDGDGDAILPEFVTVTIEYIRYGYVKQLDGEYAEEELGVAFSPYIATLKYGAALNTVVASPTIVGYDSYVVQYDSNNEKVLTKQSTVAIDIDAVTENVSFTVEYHPAEVPYEVHYFFQNIYDDLYVEDASLTKQLTGFTGLNPDESYTKAKYEGFTSLYYVPETIAADGSTVFEVYYERNYYLMEFDCNGGYGTDTIYVRYGTYISVPNPIKSGYLFDYWNILRKTTKNLDTNEEIVTDMENNLQDEDDILPNTMPAYNSAYGAVWSTAATSYSVVYWAENANDTDYSYWGTAVFGLGANGKPDGSVQSASKISGADHSTVPNTLVNYAELSSYFTYNSELTLFKESERDDLQDGKVVVEGDGSTIVNVYFKRNVYTITFTDSEISSCQIPEHNHTEECYLYLCHQHDSSCYVCGLEEHVHSSTCCSLFHAHSEKCAGSCTHLHNLNCYTSNNPSEATGGNTGYSAVIAAAGSSPIEAAIYRYRSDTNNTNSRNYYNYIYLLGKWYYLGTGNGDNILGFIWSGDNPARNRVAVSQTINDRICTHVHEEKCYNCGLEPHDHIDDSCDVAACVANGVEHSHGASCYTCGMEEMEHDETCCALTEHEHTSCAPTNCKHTAHGIECYSFVGGTVSTSASSGLGSNISLYRTHGDLKVYRRWSSGYEYYLLYNGAYYRIQNYDQGSFSGTIECKHLHDDSCYACGIQSHIHGIGCDFSSCIDSLHHTHTSSCLACIPHTHSAICPKALVCGQVAHKHSSDDREFDDSIVKILERKYGSYIGDEWIFETKDGIVYPHEGDASSWNPIGSTLKNRLAMIDIMPGEDFELRYYPQNNPLRYYNYYIECLDGEAYDTQYNGKNYKHYFSFGTLVIDFNIYTEAEDFFPISGFTKNVVTNGSRTVSDGYRLDSGETLNFYYTRNEYKLNYYNYYDFLKDGSGDELSETLKYQQPLQNYQLTESFMEQEENYPSTLEPGAYDFGGWYISSGCFPGTEVNWGSDTMPNGNLTIYAKWTPITHEVYFYETLDDIPDKNYWYTVDENGIQTPSEYPIIVEHGELLGTAYDYIPKLEGYYFVGWFYIDDDGKKRFAPDSMEVKRDLHLFAEWQSEIDTTYTVNYILADDIIATDGTVLYSKGTVLAEETFGHVTAGKTKTFVAKARNELNEVFRNYSLFPKTNSHSILMKEDGNENVYSFEYVYDKEVWYKIKYINKITGSSIYPEYVDKTDEAIITKKFVPISGFIPEKYYIQKVLASDGEAGSSNNVNPDNEIIFYYFPDEEHGLYTIIYYKETMVDGVYEQVQSEIGSGDVDMPISRTIEPNKFKGFAPSKSTVTTYQKQSDGTWKGTEKTYLYPDTKTPSGMLTAGGLEIRIYYDRNSYPYVIKFVDNFNNPLGYGMLNPDGSVASGSSGSPIFAIGDINDAAPIAIYESILKYTAPQEIRVGEAIYLLQSEETQQKNIRDETLGSDGNYSSLALNVITFTYIQKKVAVIYRAVCKANVPLGFGEVSINQELVSSVDGIGGSNAMAGSGYRFIGWYKDEACADSDMVPAEWVYDPNPADDDLAKTHLKPQTLNTLLDEVVYYALFEPIYGGIEISKSGVETQDAVDHHFLFRVKGKDTNNQHIDLIVSVLGNGTVSIENVPIGDYNVTELTDWSWDYECEDDTNEVVVTEDQVSKTEFSNQTKNSNWLSGEAENENVFD